MKLGEKIILRFFFIFGILSIIIAFLYILDNNYLKLQFSNNNVKTIGKIIKFNEYEKDEYRKYVFVNNPTMYISSMSTEDIVTYYVTIKLPEKYGNYIFYEGGLDEDDLKRMRSKGVNLIFDKDDINIIAINELWINFWIPLTLFLLGFLFIALSKLMFWVLK